ncbi:MAG: type pilus assembly protein PilN [Thermodesulfobacteriota bacterium]|nr:type pilus assembly protein PilN [Thermodesulfobacteriota bacterium]
MIRINLLPFRAARKKENIRREVSVYFLTLVFLIAVMAYLQTSSSSRLSELKAEEEGARKELVIYEKNNRMAAEIKVKTKEIKDRLAVIRDLEAKKGGPLKVLSEIALAVPEDRLWLQSLVENGGALTISGTAMDNDTVALFMTNLEKAASISSVDLKGTQLQDFPKYNVKASGFVITCQTALQQAPSESEQKKTDAKGKQ